MKTDDFKFQIPLTPTRGVTLWERSHGILAPAYSYAPGATPGGWTQVSRLAHDFLVGPDALITMALSYALAIVLPQKRPSNVVRVGETELVLEGPIVRERFVRRVTA